MRCSLFISGVEITCTLLEDIHCHLCLSCWSLPHTHTDTDTNANINFYLLSQAWILNHISVSLPSFISNIYSHQHSDHTVCVLSFLSSIIPACNPLTWWQCQWNMNVFSEVMLVWSAALTMSFVSGLNRKLKSYSEAQAKVHTVGCNSMNISPAGVEHLDR